MADDLQALLNKINEEELKHFEISDDVVTAEYCKDSGLCITNACLHDPRGDRREIGYFMRGEEPTGYCSVHVPVAYDRVEGGVCLSGSCPHLNIDYIGLICVERSFPTQIYVTDAQYVWRDLPDGGRIELSPSLPFFSKILDEKEYCGISKTEIQFNRACRRHLTYSRN